MEAYFSGSGNFPLYYVVLAWIALSVTAGSAALYLIEAQRFPFGDCFFLAVSAVTCTGLATVNLLDLSSASLAVLTLLPMCGSGILLSVVPVLVRLCSACIFLSRTTLRLAGPFNLRCECII